MCLVCLPVLPENSLHFDSGCGEVIGADPSNHCKLRSCLVQGRNGDSVPIARSGKLSIRVGVGAVSAGLDSQSLRAFLFAASRRSV